MEVITFVNYIPPARFDALPWTEVRIEEAAAVDGSFVALETIPLAPLDIDPAYPAARSFTTQLGTALGYWYRIYFADVDGDISQPTTPVQNVAGSTLPSVQAYAPPSELLRILGVRAPSAEQTAAAQRVLDAAAIEIDSEVGRAEPYANPPALVVQVNLDRAVEHWQSTESPFGVFGFGDAVAVPLSRDTWDRHAIKLAPLKVSWGIA